MLRKFYLSFISVLAVLCAEGTAQSYQPPLLLAAPPPPLLQPIVHNSYQPPLPQPQQADAPPASLHRLESSAPLSSAPSALSAERTYSTHTQVVGSAAASEIQPSKLPSAQEKDNKNDEYVVYYYYYYDNDTSTAGNQSNPSANFDDIPSLENYDERKEPENALSDATQPRNASQPRLAPSGLDNTVIKADAQPPPQLLKPVSNVFRYGSNEVPRFPVIPNFVLSETTTIPSTPTTAATAPAQGDESLYTTPVFAVSLDESEDDTLNNVLDSTPDLKDLKEEEPTTTTTPEPTTTTEIPTTTTTTEKPRRRPSLGGGSRRQFNNNRPSFSSTRNRSPSRGDTSSSSSSTSTTTSASTTRRSFQGSNNRFRSRPSGFRGSSRTTEASDDKSTIKASEVTTASSTTTSRSRFGGGSSATRGRFQSSRSRGASTSRTPASVTSASLRTTSRTTSRPRPNPIIRNRPSRPGFLRPRPGSDPEEPSTTTAAPVEEVETSPEANELSSTAEEEVEKTSEEEEEEEEPTTTEASRFSALFRPRNRASLGNRPRPVIGNRPGRS